MLSMLDAIINGFGELTNFIMICYVINVGWKNKRLNVGCLTKLKIAISNLSLKILNNYFLKEMLMDNGSLCICMKNVLESC